MSENRAAQEQGRSRVLLVLFALLALAILIGLGDWQLRRRTWKNDLISRLETSLASPPAAYRPPDRDSPPEAAQREFRRVRVTGEFLPRESWKVFAVAPPEERGETGDPFGYMIFTPLRFDGRTIMVNRGYAPRTLADKIVSDTPSGPQTVTGLLRAAEAPSFVTPKAEHDKRVEYVSDIGEMAATSPSLVRSEYIEASPEPGDARWPKARDPHALLAAIPNRHLEYALTWFGLAAALCGVVGVYWLRK